MEGVLLSKLVTIVFPDQKLHHTVKELLGINDFRFLITSYRN